MSDAPAQSRIRLVLVVVLALSIVAFLLQLFVLRPRLWPAGAGLTLSGDTVFASLAQPRAVPRIRPPEITGVAGAAVEIREISPIVPVDAGLTPGTRVDVISADGVRIDVSRGIPSDAEGVLRTWRDAYRMGPLGSVSLQLASEGPNFRQATIERAPVWQLDASVRQLWYRTHLGALAQVAAFLTGAFALIALGTRGATATLMTGALIATGIANAGPLLGAEQSVPVIGPLVLLFGWLVTPLAFPVIGLAVLYFPRKADVLDRYPWIHWALIAVATPMLIVSVLAAGFLLGADAFLPALTWVSMHGWVFDASFAAALAANVLIAIEGIGRYRGNPDISERRRIEIVVYTGVPAVFAYAIKTGVPLLSSLAGQPLELPLMLEALLQAIVLLPAFGLPYAVAVRRVFSPRTVLRRSLQYALARRTLSVVVLLPIIALAFSLFSDRRRALADILIGQPLFYAAIVGLIFLGLRNREKAQQWLDRRFFRSEYDAREILVSLASKVPYENDPRELVAMVLTQVDTALHPESVAVLAGEETRLEVISALRSTVDPIPRDGGIATLLRWSDEPLEIFLDDERSPSARLPAADRQWLQAGRIALLVPIFTGTGDARALIGLIALGQKQSEEPYTAEDRRLLSGLAAQMSIALDLSRLRRKASETQATGALTSLTPTLTPTMVVGGPAAPTLGLGMCGRCHRCFDLGIVPLTQGVRCCPDDGEVLQAVASMPPIVDGKYRVDAVVGRGGMGAVFRARDMRLDRDIAIKIVRADLVSDPESRTRFRREAQIVARLQHPAIVTVFDYGNLPDGAAFLVMEFVPGEDLRHVLKRERTLTALRTIDLITGVATGVEAAHRAGILHRDLKPENILLPASGTGPKVLDFGVAKITHTAGSEQTGTITQGATIVGTPAYMAPEQLRGDSVDGRADVYSLAVITFEAITGVLPFGGGSFFDVGISQASAPSAADRLPAGIAPVILQALSIERDERPVSPAAFAAALRGQAL